VPITQPDLVEFLSIIAGKFPERSAIVHSGIAVSYAKILDDSRKLAEVFIENGLQGKLVGVMTPATPQAVVLYYACLIARAVLVPINYSFRLRELGSLLDNCRLSVLCYYEDYERELRKTGERFEQVPTKLPMGLNSDSACIGQAFSVECMHGFCQVSSGHLSSQDSAVIFHTSGTTGKPKGAVHSIQSVSYFAKSYQCLVVNDFEPRTLIARNCYHSGGFFHLTGALSSGATCFLNDTPSGFDAEAFLRQLEEYRITQVFLSVSMLNAILASKTVSSQSFRSARFISVGADEVRPYHFTELRKYTSLPLSVRYSSTEATCVSIEFSQSAEQDAVSVGIPQRHFEWRLDSADRKSGVGELQLKGPSVFSEYHNNKSETDSSFTHDGWYRTGDLFRVNGLKQLIFCGRTRNTIKVGGKIVYPSEIEAAANSHSAVKDSVAVAIPHSIEVQVPFLFVQPLSGAKLCDMELLSFLTDILACYKVPAGILIVGEFPLTRDGKIDRQQLASLATQYANRSRSNPEVRSETSSYNFP
jgi:long-chain acyl-CoA synthetase